MKLDTVYTDVSLLSMLESGETRVHTPGRLQVCLGYDPSGISARVINEKDTVVLEFPITRSTECCRCNNMSYLFSLSTGSIVIVFSSSPDCQRFHAVMQKFRAGQAVSVFSERTEEASASQYFQFYSYLSQQQNMMQDYIRTCTYQTAILSNRVDFENKVVLDVGAGSGILSFFAAQAGAKTVYAVEASSISVHAKRLVEYNMVNNVIQVIEGKIEEVELPELVDIIISEPMGYMLYNERMLETYLHGKKWLKPGGKMFPGRGDLHIAPFQDDPLYIEQFSKANFWNQTSFHGVNLTSLQELSMEEYFRQPIVDTFDIRICMAKSVRHVLDFEQAHETDLHQINIPVEFHMLESGTVHGLAFWFDVGFFGSQRTVWLSTAPTEPITHWYQVRCLLQQPLLAKAGQLLTGSVLMVANQRQSYDVTISLQIEGTGASSRVTLDLKNPYFRYTGTQPQPPPGHNTTSPSEQYWLQLDSQGAKQAVNLLNEMAVNGLGEVAMDTNSSQTMISGNMVPSNQTAAIHPGSIPTALVNNTATTAAGGAAAPPQPTAHVPVGAKRSSAAPVIISSASQLIGGAVSPALMAGQIGSTAGPQTAPAMLAAAPSYPVNSPLMIGDYLMPSGAVSVTASAPVANSGVMFNQS